MTPIDERIEQAITRAESEQSDEAFRDAQLLLEEALAAGEDPELLWRYGYIAFETPANLLLRDALRIFERAVELDPGSGNKAHHYLIRTHVRLLQTKDAIELYKARLAAAPEDVGEYRLLAEAYLWVGAYEEAGTVVQAGLELEPGDLGLLASWGSVLEGRGEPDEALATWERVFELESDRYVSALYSRVFLLARLGRLEAAAVEWERIIAWLEERGYLAQCEWPRRELAQLRERIAAGE